MAFDTAIFYDIENLLKGYNFSQEIVANLSLTEIVGAVKATAKIGQIALQRAYANWSDPRLAIMRGEINELGIDPIQVFGFSRDAQKKNAADIQLAIEAIDLAHLRPALQVFVIVSGDGGFSALAKKLHEYGKTVIGCAYRSAANRTFRAVCDEFIWIPDPEGEAGSEPRPAGADRSAAPVTDPRNGRLLARVKKIDCSDAGAVFAKTREILRWYATDAASKSDLTGQGLYLSVVQEGLRAIIGGFETVRFGYPKLVEYLQFACSQTPVCVVRRANNQPVLMLRAAVPNTAEVLPDLEERQVHTPEVYRAVLSTGPPILRVPPAGDLAAVAGWIVEHRPRNTELGVLIDAAASELASASSESVKLALLALVSSGVFERNSEGVPISEQKLTLRESLGSAPALLEALYGTGAEKLAAAFGEVKVQVLSVLIPRAGY